MPSYPQGACELQTVLYEMTRVIYRMTGAKFGTGHCVRSTLLQVVQCVMDRGQRSKVEKVPEVLLAV
jgi:hypothetical protein